MNNETNYCGERKSCQKGDCKGCLLRGIEEPKLGEECGVFGMYDLDGNDVASSIYYGLFAPAELLLKKRSGFTGSSAL